DLLRERYGSPKLGVVTSLLIMVFITVNLIPQFKAGAILIKSVLPPGWAETLGVRSATSTVDSGDYLGLLIFTATVAAYTTYGGFVAAIWSDVFQSIIMAVGVLILLPYALSAAGGLEQATTEGMRLTDPGFAFAPGAGREFHTVTLAISFFFMWAISGA